MVNAGIPRIRSLSNLGEGETGEIIQVRGKPEIHRFLCGRGLMMGRKISVSAADSASPEASLTIQSGDMVSVIGRDLAHNIKVRVA
jgi:Fe2+ transport system protein FeoA